MHLREFTTAKHIFWGRAAAPGCFPQLRILTVFARAYLSRSPKLFGRNMYERLMMDITFDRTWGWSTEYGAGTLYHTGFSGTSILLDLKQNRAFILLTNRIHPSRENLKFLEERKKLNRMFLQ